MSSSFVSRERADHLERLMAEDVGRNIGALAAGAAGGLARAATSLRSAKRATIITGFFIPRAAPPAAETDGPIGAALIAAALVARGVDVRMATDAPCAPVVAAAITGAGLASAVPLDIAAVEGFVGGVPIDELVRTRAAQPPDHVVAIERCGPGADGRPYNFRGEDIGAHTAELHRLFVSPSFLIGIGDGGNELGMGSLPADVVAADVAEGARVACRVAADALIVAGVSNWAGAALALALGHRVDGRTHDRLLDAIVEAGAVDGITATPSRSVDGRPPAFHAAMIDRLAAEAFA
ncbi:MAG: glutamate cyclase domain-containing protein [Pseudomonadota bacterium]